jgi:hypothetical protein
LKINIINKFGGVWIDYNIFILNKLINLINHNQYGLLLFNDTDEIFFDLIISRENTKFTNKIKEITNNLLEKNNLIDINNIYNQIKLFIQKNKVIIKDYKKINTKEILINNLEEENQNINTIKDKNFVIIKKNIVNNFINCDIKDIFFLPNIIGNLIFYSFKNKNIIKENINISSCNWYPDGGNNFGDMITPYIYKKIFNIYPKKNIGNSILLGAGSILGFMTNSNSIVWGSGFGSINCSEKYKNVKKIISVRGHLTRNLIISKKIECPEIFGDIGLILPFFYNPKNIIKKYKIGFIPHWIDYNIFKKIIKKNKNILIINLQDNFEKIINEILSCEITISTSLHGIIVSHAYQIHTAWGRISKDLNDKILGGYFKYNDYFSSLNMKSVEPIIINKNMEINNLMNDIKKYEQPNINELNKVKYNTLYLCPLLNKKGK